MRDEGGGVGDGRVVGVPKSHSWGMCTMRLMSCHVVFGPM